MNMISYIKALATDLQVTSFKPNEHFLTLQTNLKLLFIVKYCTILIFQNSD